MQSCIFIHFLNKIYVLHLTAQQQHERQQQLHKKNRFSIQIIKIVLTEKLLYIVNKLSDLIIWQNKNTYKAYSQT